MSLSLLFLRFLLIGLFTIGGGLVAIPLLHDMIAQYQLLSDTQFLSMVAIAQSTPGSIGVNISTFVGLSQQGVMGGILASFAFILPSMICITLIARFAHHFLEHPFIIKVFSGIRPAVTGIIASVTITLALTLVDFSSLSTWGAQEGLSLLLFVAVLGMKIFTKVPPALLIIGSGALGVLLF